MRIDFNDDVNSLDAFDGRASCQHEHLKATAAETRYRFEQPASKMFGRSFYTHLAAALLIGLLLRLFFVMNFPTETGDTKYYEEFAGNWLNHGVYGSFVLGRLTPLGTRMPGYPAFLVAVYAVLGKTRTAVMIAQSIIDLVTCLLAAAIAARLAPAGKQGHLSTPALWIAVICPFTANYCAVVLTEVLAAFLTTLTLLLLVCVLASPWADLPISSLGRKDSFLFVGWFLAGGVITGIGTLVRPEMPLVLMSVGLILCVRWRHRDNWSKLVLTGSWMTVGLLLPLMPWAARNALSLGRIQFLAPRYAQIEGDFVQRGFHAWTGTWVVRNRYAYLLTWKINREALQIKMLPNSAFDSAGERTRVATLLNRYNSNGPSMTPLLDHEFAVLAGERTRRKPERTYLFIPFLRACAMWFTPRIELLPYSGDIWPLSDKWQRSRKECGTTLMFGFLNFVYIGLAVVGAWRHRRHPAMSFLIAFIVLRTVFLTQMQTVEQRYVVLCFPVLSALGGVAHLDP